VSRVGRVLALTRLAGIAAKVENVGQYDEYLQELKPIREELGVNLKENMYPDSMAGERLGQEGRKDGR